MSTSSQQIRMLLSKDDLEIIESWGTRLCSDHPAEAKLLTKVRKSLVTVGGRISKKPSVADFAGESDPGSGVVSGGGPRSATDDIRLNKIAEKVVMDLPLTEDEKQFYFNHTGMTL